MAETFTDEVWAELVRAEGNKNDESEAFGIERQHHGVDFDHWPPTEAEARAWYRTRVWEGLGIPKLPEALRIDFFLFALNVDLTRAPLRYAPVSSRRGVRALQAALNALGHKVTIDEQMGPQTLRAASRTPHGSMLLVAFRSAAVMYYAGLTRFKDYAQSWLRRMEAL